jgi:hypothetical protein
VISECPSQLRGSRCDEPAAARPSDRDVRLSRARTFLLWLSTKSAGQESRHSHPSVSSPGVRRVVDGRGGTNIHIEGSYPHSVDPRVDVPGNMPKAAQTQWRGKRSCRIVCSAQAGWV